MLGRRDRCNIPLIVFFLKKVMWWFYYCPSVDNWLHNEEQITSPTDVHSFLLSLKRKACRPDALCLPIRNTGEEVGPGDDSLEDEE